MSEYAEIKNGKVINVIVIDDSWTEDQAQSFLSKISSNMWKKTEKKAGKGFEYHAKEGIITRKKAVPVLDTGRKNKDVPPSDT